MTIARLTLILVVDGAMALALMRFIWRPRAFSLIGAVLIGVVVLPAALLLSAGLAELAGKGGSKHRLLATPSGATSAPAVMSDCRLAGSRPVPARCRPEPALAGSFSLERDAIRSEDGSRLGLTSGWLDSYTEESRVVGAQVHVRGWAAAPRVRRPADAILAFAGGRFIGAVAPTRLRADIAKKYGSTAALSGFSVALPSRTVRREDGRFSMRLFAVQGTKAAELVLDCARKPDLIGC